MSDQREIPYMLENAVPPRHSQQAAAALVITPPPGEAGWEQRLENLARAQEWAAELRESIADNARGWIYQRLHAHAPLTPDEYADALIAGPLAPLLEAQAAVQRVEALAKDLQMTSAVPIHRREAADRIWRALGGTT